MILSTRRAHRWAEAERNGMAVELSEYVIRYGAHWGWDGGEIPRYEPCFCCGTTLRADRLDLVSEHLEACWQFRPFYAHLSD